MAVDYMLLTITHTWQSWEGGLRRMDASGLVSGEETFLRSDDQPPVHDVGQQHVPWVLGFVSRILGELGDDDWSLISNSNFDKATVGLAGNLTFLLSRPC